MLGTTELWGSSCPKHPPRMDLLCGEVPLGVEEVVLVLGEDGHVVLLHNGGVGPLLDHLQVDGVRLIWRGRRSLSSCRNPCSLQPAVQERLKATWRKVAVARNLIPLSQAGSGRPQLRAQSARSSTGPAAASQPHSALAAWLGCAAAPTYGQGALSFGIQLLQQDGHDGHQLLFALLVGDEAAFQLKKAGRRSSQLLPERSLTKELHSPDVSFCQPE